MRIRITNRLRLLLSDRLRKIFVLFFVVLNCEGQLKVQSERDWDKLPMRGRLRRGGPREVQPWAADLPNGWQTADFDLIRYNIAVVLF